MPSDKRYRIWGTRFATSRLIDLPRAAAGAAWLLGPAAWVTIARSRLGDARRAERQWAAMAWRLLGMRLEVSGIDNIDPSERYVVAPLHEGFADVITLLRLPLRLRFVARDELAQWYALGAALRSGKHVIVRPESSIAAFRELLRRGSDILKTDSLVVFPQGTILGIESTFGAGAFHLARVSGRPLLPIVITGTHRVWEHPFSPVVRFRQPVRVEVLPALRPEAAVAEMRETEKLMKRTALAAAPQPRRFDPDRDGWWDDYRYEIDPDFRELADRVHRHRRELDG